MQSDIHPDYPLITVTLADGTEFQTRSTTGKDLKSEVDSSNHPFYTGKKTMVDTAGRVEKFMRRYGKSQAKQAVAAQEEADADEAAREAAKAAEAGAEA
ncbi:50S ribosomal protein L31 [Rubrivirga sp. IMCC45206]|uniref:50S ribosomal protein L31 n=1 Tax=Rubrivirga sp. IMCC45206 TaxID=3391614 RepID=UPI00398FC189